MLSELERANKIHGEWFASPHEGYAVILEELEELFAEIKKKKSNNLRMIEEAIQVGAMAVKLIMSIELIQSDPKCLHCVYVVMTAAELTECGCDPCETCNHDLCNWQPK